jgi:geranylgeranyl pyrophosphate synthase
MDNKSVSRGLGIVPRERAEREHTRSAVRRYMASVKLVPPLSMEELEMHARSIVTRENLDPATMDFVTVLVSNEVWWDTVASVPFERRVLLLPQCLRDRATCPAVCDELGVMCQECGRCPIGRIQTMAEKLGYVVLVAEGTTVVTRLLEQGRVDAVVGASCLHALERSFPHMSAEAIPGIAFPLYQDGCNSTRIDLDWLEEAVQLRSAASRRGRLDLEGLIHEVQEWFGVEALRRRLVCHHTRTENLVLAWMAKGGKRWRPFLSASAFRALHAGDEVFPENIRLVAIAVECFHKASLIHDDIEDNDDFRYGDMTLHRQHGVPVALNAGDLLLGEGYRMIAECDVTAAQRERMLRVAAEGHRSLALGQGEEIAGWQNPVPPDPATVLDIFRLKTAPAFDVALQLGCICGGADESVCRVLSAYSQALGVAYQIRDDLNDFLGDQEKDSPVGRLGLSILLSLACEADAGAKELIGEAWRTGVQSAGHREALRQAVKALPVEEKAHQLLEHHRNEALRALNPLEHAPLKGLLRRMVKIILDRERSS